MLRYFQAFNYCFILKCCLSEYYGVVTIPAGAQSIRIMELNTSSSYLAVRDTQRHYYLNGYWTVDWPGRHSIAGAIFEYKRPYNRPESLLSAGPTNESLIIEVSNRKQQHSADSSSALLPDCTLTHDSFFRYCCRAGIQVCAGNTL